MPSIKRIIHEAHRRSLWQVLGVYLASSWVALEVVTQLTLSMGLPDWVPSFAVVLLVIGLPIVMATAFVQEGPARRAEGEAAAAEPGPAGAQPEAGSATPDGLGGLVEHGEGGRFRRLLTWRNAILGGVLAFALLGVVTAGYMAMRTLGIGPVGTLVAQGVLEERDRILLADFRNRTDDALLSEVVTEALRVDLSQSKTVRLAEPAFVAEARERMEVPADAPLDAELAREAAEREGIEAVLAGEVGSLGASYVLTARLLDPESGEILTSQRVSAADSTELVAAIDRLSKKLRERIGESLKSLRGDPPLARVTTGSLEALRKYSQAVRAIQEEGEQDRGIALLEEAVALDTAFAMAWRKLGVVLGNRREDRARQVEALERAYRHRDRLTERERYYTEGTYHWDVAGDHPRAITAYRNLLELEPRNGGALNNLGLVYHAMGDYARAEELFRRSIEADSTSGIPYVNLVAVRVHRGAFAGAWEVLSLTERRFPGVPRAGQLAVQVAAAQGDYGRAEERARTLRREQRGSLYFREVASRRLAALDAIRGRLAEAGEHLEDAGRAARERGIPSRALEAALLRGRLELFLLGDTARALARVERGLEATPLSALDPLNRPYLELAGLYAAAGRPARARELLSGWRKAVPSGLRRGPAARDELRVRATLALAEGRHGEAAEAFRRFHRERRFCPDCGLPGLAEAYDRAGKRDSAIAAYERYLETPSLGRMFTDQYVLPHSLERLAALHEEAGRPAEAAEYHRRLVELWAEADPRLQPRVERARERLAALEGSGDGAR